MWFVIFIATIGFMALVGVSIAVFQNRDVLFAKPQLT
jgi:hypothetical protein